MLIGIEKFNHAARTTIPEHVPMSGVRAFKLYGYVPSVVIFGYYELAYYYDRLAWPPKFFYKTFWFGVRASLALAYEAFVLWPFSTWIRSVQVKIVWIVWAKSGLPRWCSYAIFLPLLVLWDNVFGG